MVVYLETVPTGVMLPVKEKAGAEANGFHGTHNGALQVTVTEAPEHPQANQAIMDVLAQKLRLRKSQIVLLTGQSTLLKHFLIHDITREELAKRIDAALHG